MQSQKSFRGILQLSFSYCTEGRGMGVTGGIAWAGLGKEEAYAWFMIYMCNARLDETMAARAQYKIRTLLCVICQFAGEDQERIEKRYRRNTQPATNTCTLCSNAEQVCDRAAACQET